MRFAQTVLFSTLALSCGDLMIDLPDPATETRALLLIFNDDTGAAVHGLQPKEQSVWTLWNNDPWPESMQMTVLQYTKSLSQIGVPAGEVDLANTSEHGVPIPPFLLGHQAALEEAQTDDDWRAITALDAPLSAIRIRVPSVFECTKNGGCLGGDRSTEPYVCETPCPEQDAPLMPVEPEPPQLLPCPSGWQETSVATATICVPWTVGTATCSEFETRFVGDQACELVGAFCPTAGEWASDLPIRSTLFVRPGSSGDGTAQSPLGSLNEALQVAENDALVALSAGVYQEPISISRDVTIWGACPEETVLGRVLVSNASVALHNLRMRGGLSANASTIDLSDIIIETSTTWALSVSDGTARLDTVVLRDAPLGFRVVNGSAEIDRVFVSDIGRYALQAITATLSVARTAVVSSARGFYGSNAQVSFEQAVFDQLDSRAIQVNNSRLNLDRIVIRGTRTTVPEENATGLAAMEYSRVEGQRIYISETEGHGVFAHSGSELLLEDVVVHRSAGLEDNAGGIESAANAGHLELSRVLFADNEVYGLLLSGDSMDLQDLRIVGTTEHHYTARIGTGLVVNARVKGSINRIAIERSLGRGARIRGEDIDIALNDLSIVEMRAPAALGKPTFGMEVSNEAIVVLNRVQIIDVDQIGMNIWDAGSVDARSVGIERCLITPCDSFTCIHGNGVGLAVGLGATTTFHQFSIQGSDAYGVSLSGGEKLVLQDGTIAQNSTGMWLTKEEEIEAHRVRFVGNVQDVDRE